MTTQKSLCFPLGVPIMRQRGWGGKGPLCGSCKPSTPPRSFSAPWLSLSHLYAEQPRGWVQGAECGKGRSYLSLPKVARTPWPGTGQGPRNGLRRGVQWERVEDKGGSPSRETARAQVQGGAPSPDFAQSRPAHSPPVTVRYQPPRVVSLNGHFWRWPGRCRSPEPLDSHWPFPEPQGRPQGLSYSPGLHRSPCNKGLRPRWCINKGALSRKQGSRKGGWEEEEGSGRGRWRLQLHVQTPFFLKSDQGSSS